MYWTLLGWLAGCHLACDANRVENVARDFAGADAIECTDAECSLEAYESGENSVFASTPTTGIDSVIHKWIVTNDEGMWFFSYDRLGARSAKHCIDPRASGDGIGCATLEPRGNHYAVCGAGDGSPQPIPFDDR